MGVRMSEKLELRKGGKLVETKWVYDKQAKKGEYKEFDRTANGLRHLFDTCVLAPDVTLKDIFLFLNTELDIYDTVIGNWCKEIVTEGLTQPEKPYDLSKYDPEQIEYLELRYTPEYDLDGDDKDVFYGFHRPDFGGVGVELQNDGDQEHYKKGDRIPWGISFSKANDLINIPVKLCDKFVVYEGILKWDKVSKGTKVLAEFNNPSYTLGGILEAIIWEMSFHGGPEKRDEFGSELKETVAKIKSGEVETTEFTDIDEWLGEYEEEAKKRGGTAGDTEPSDSTPT